MSVRVSVILFLATGVSGVLFNGSCPKAQGTHHSLLMSISSNDFRRVLHAVPFSVETKSYLFRKKFGVNYGLRVNFKNYNQEEYQVKLQYSKSGHFVKGNSKLGGQGQSLTLKSGIYKHAFNSSIQGIRVECHQELEEQVRVWIDDDFIFIWSCQDRINGSFDEAVIVIAKEYFPDVPGMDKKIENKLNTTARKYLGGYMLTHFNFYGIEIVWDRDDTLFPCPAVKPVPGMLIICIGLVLIFLIYVGVIIWFHVKDSFVRGRVTYLNQ